MDHTPAGPRGAAFAPPTPRVLVRLQPEWHRAPGATLPSRRMAGGAIPFRSPDAHLPPGRHMPLRTLLTSLALALGLVAATASAAQTPAATLPSPGGATGPPGPALGSGALPPPVPRLQGHRLGRRARAAIPKVEAARDRAAYAEAVQDMLDTLRTPPPTWSGPRSRRRTRRRPGPTPSASRGAGRARRCSCWTCAPSRIATS